MSAGVGSTHSAETSAYAYLQLSAEQGASQGGGVDFGADRARVGGNLGDGPLFAGIQLDIAVANSGVRPPGTLPAVVKDLFAEYRFSDAFAVKAGQFKTPLGMDFNLSARSLTSPSAARRNPWLSSEPSASC